MVEKTSNDDVRRGPVEREGGVESGPERVREWRVSEVGLALVYLLSFAAVGLCWANGHGAVAAVGGVGLLVAMTVCLLTAFRGQLLTSVVLMGLVLWLIVLKDPQSVAYAIEELFADEGTLIDFTD